MLFSHYFEAGIFLEDKFKGGKLSLLKIEGKNFNHIKINGPYLQ